MTTLTNETYKEMQDRHTKEMNDFMEDCIFFAFNSLKKV